MAERIVITAMGICSALGDNLEEHLTGLLSGQSGLSVVENVSTLHRDHIRVGEIKHTNDFLAQQLGLPVVNHYSRTGLLGIWALKEAIAQAGLTPTEVAQLSMVMASSVGGMDMTERYFYAYTTQEELRRYIPYHNIGEVTGQIADRCAFSIHYQWLQ